MEGNIIVDGVLASCYPSADHNLAHFGMSPIRLFPTIVEWIFGKDVESPGFLNVVNELGGWMLPYELTTGMKSF